MFFTLAIQNSIIHQPWVTSDVFIDLTVTWCFFPGRGHAVSSYARGMYSVKDSKDF